MDEYRRKLNKTKPQMVWNLAERPYFTDEGVGGGGGGGGGGMGKE